MNSPERASLPVRAMAVVGFTVVGLLMANYHGAIAEHIGADPANHVTSALSDGTQNGAGSEADNISEALLVSGITFTIVGVAMGGAGMVGNHRRARDAAASKTRHDRFR